MHTAPALDVIDGGWACPKCGHLFTVEPGTTDLRVSVLIEANARRHAATCKESQ